MADARSRELERQASQGDHDASLRFLRERMRGESELKRVCEVGRDGGCTLCDDTGFVPFSWQERTSLMFYCGMDVKPLVDRIPIVPSAWSAAEMRRLPFYNWSRGLDHWPKEVKIRAAVVAVKCMPCVHGEVDPLCCSVCVMAIHATEAVEDWLACPCSSHRREIQDSVLPSRMPVRLRGARSRVTVAFHLLCGTGWDDGAGASSLNASISLSAADVGEGVIREAIQEALISWVLS